ncbi:MAG: bifunctional precorrin-2 dehydrogenase/sirohydrochlorin ferrochelatase [FCB group bacterium]|jgi:siroheme synthase-like protein
MKAKPKLTYLPVLIDMEKFNCLVVGGDLTAFNKVKRLLDFGASITVMATTYCPEMQELFKSKKVKVIKKSYEPEDVLGYNLVFAATGNIEIDEMLQRDCEEANIMINVSDVPRLCSFILPATIIRGDITISIGSQGNAPFYTKALEDYIDSFLSPFVSDVADLAAEFRFKMFEKEIYHDETKRNELIEKFIKNNWEMDFYKLGRDATYKKMNEMFE